MPLDGIPRDTAGYRAVEAEFNRLREAVRGTHKAIDEATGSVKGFDTGLASITASLKNSEGFRQVLGGFSRLREGINRGRESIDQSLKSIDRHNARMELARRLGIETGEAIRSGFTRATLAVGGFAAAGFHGTLEADRLGLQMRRLSQEVASVFKPAFDEAGNAVAFLANEMKGLSGSQQDNLMRMGLLGAGGLAAGRLLPLGAIGSTAVGAGAIGAAGIVGAGYGARQLNQFAGGVVPDPNAIRVTQGRSAADVYRMATLADRQTSRWDKFRYSITESVVGTVADAMVLAGNAGASTIGSNTRFNRKSFAPPGDQLRWIAGTKEGTDQHRNVTPGLVGFEGITETFRRIQVATLQQSLASGPDMNGPVVKILSEIRDILGGKKGSINNDRGGMT